MRSDDNTLMNVRKWLEENDYSQAWLANEMSISLSLVSQLFNNKRILQPKHIIKMSEITGMSIPALAHSETDFSEEPIYSLRGSISTKAGERALRQLLLDAEHFVQLLDE